MFRHQQPLKYSIFKCMEWVYYSTEGRTIFHFTQIQCTFSPSQNLEYLDAKNCWNISFSCVLSSHIIPKANQFSPKYLFSDSVHMLLSCKKYSLEYFGAKSCQNISFSGVLSAPITPNTNQYSLKSFGSNYCQNIAFSHVLSANIITSVTHFRVPMRYMNSLI